ncbi:MAG: transglycosylase SLT domain-containing protein [Oligoflexia bacterium]|nr:transglycosylase SLT domain-containing protein [Oligoflexia bacterium]
MNLLKKLDAPEAVSLILQLAEIIPMRKDRINFLKEQLSWSLKQSPPKHKPIEEVLYKLSPSLSPLPQDWIKVGADALRSFEFELAEAAFRKALTKRLDYSSNRAALDGLRNALKSQQKKSELMTVLYKLRKLPTTQKKWAQSNALRQDYLMASLGLARQYWTNHNDKRALKIIRETEQKLGQPSTESVFLKSLIYLEQGKSQTALAQLEKLSEESRNKASEPWQWPLAWNHFKAGNWEKAKQAFNKILDIETEVGKLAQANFWLAKSLEKSGEPKAARKIYENLVEVDSMNYYGILAARELNVELKSLKPEPEDRSRELSVENRLLLDLLIEVKRTDLAQNLLEAEAPFNALESSSWEKLSEWGRADLYAPVFSRVNRFASLKDRQKFFQRFSWFLFPNPYENETQKASTEAGVWRAYILAITRQESSFDPEIVSPANAYGLMQLLPQVAKPLAHRLRIKGYQKESLFKPEINTLLGAWHLREFLDEFNGQPILSTAAYNAGEEPVKSWIKSRAHLDPIEFIEDIPYEETRTYVKLVLRNFVNYLRLESSQSSIGFPQWWLEGLHPSKF